jgi:hypothetical protein
MTLRTIFSHRNLNKRGYLRLFALRNILENMNILHILKHKSTKIHKNIYKRDLYELIMEKDIGKINKGEFQGSVTEIVIGVREYKGKVGVDIREFVSGEKYTGPTKKGLRIPAEKFEEFKTMINSVTERDLEPSEPASEEKQETQKTFKKKTSSKKEEVDEELPDY